MVWNRGVSAPSASSISAPRRADAPIAAAIAAPSVCAARIATSARGERGGVARERVPREPPREQRRGGGRLERDDRELLRDGGGVQRDAREPARDHAPVQHEALQKGIVRVVVGVPLALVQDSAPRQRGIVFVPVGIRAGRVRTIARGRGGGGPTTLGDAHVRRDARAGPPGRASARECGAGARWSSSKMTSRGRHPPPPGESRVARRRVRRQFQNLEIGCSEKHDADGGCQQYLGAHRSGRARAERDRIIMAISGHAARRLETEICARCVTFP